jgi:hypothetical protein
LPEIVEEFFGGGAVAGEDEDVHIEIGAASLVMTIEQPEEMQLALASVIRRMRAAKKGGGT